MSDQTPRVSIGLPVYNGEAFLAEGIESLLGQTFRDFEVVISDNASTDATEAICRAFAARDARVRYARNPVNVGAMHNFNQVFTLARAAYFKWAAHDDLHAPEYLARCVEALDSRPDVVLVFPRSREVDEKGQRLDCSLDSIVADDPRASVRFRNVIRRDHSCQAIFGLVRAPVLRATRLLGNYADCDRVLLAELGLAGKLVELPEVMFEHREHEMRSVRQYRSRQTRSAWFDPSQAGRPAMPFTRQFFDYLGAVRRAPVSARTKAACYATLLQWLARNADGLWEDVAFAARYALRPLKRRFSHASGAASRAEGDSK